ncbi:MAG: exodeoxyribonuclease I, partial [Rubrivivax sp.]
ADLNEIEAPITLFCQPPLDRLPDPESCLITGITPQRCRDLGLAEHAFAAQVLDCLGRPGTVGVGYNTVRFDDEVTRFLFWRNLIEPYGREWQNGCARWDLMDVVRCAYALRPEGIEWPADEDGRVRFKLERLSAANGLPHAAAHDALSDVRATIALARLVKARQPRLWDFCLKLRSKAAVQAELVMGRPVLHISGMYPAERGCLAVVFPLSPHPRNKNEVIVWDLAHDPAELMTLDTATLRQRLFTRQDELPEGVTRLPIKTIHLNKSPVVIRQLDTLSPQQAERWGVDKALAWRHAEVAARITGEMAGVWPEVYARAAQEGPVDVDEDLYGGFVGEADRATLTRLRGLAPEALARERPYFRDGRLEELLFRYRARNFAATLSEDERECWQAHCTGRLHEGEGGGPTLQAWVQQIDTLAEQAMERGDERAEAVLGELADWAEQVSAWSGPQQG